MSNQPKPDWGRKGTQPVGELGPPPPPNGCRVATKPIASQEVSVNRDDLGRVLSLAYANWEDRFCAPMETQEAYHRLASLYRQEADE